MKLPALREIVEERKEKAIETLSASYARNRMPLEEYERLVEYINKIESERELVVVERIVAEYKGDDEPDAPGERSGADLSGPEPDEIDDYEPANYPHYQSSLSNLAILSSRVISGPLKSGSQFVSILGSQHIKIRKADLKKRQTIMDLVSILGETTILVEPGIRVVNKVIPILGGSWTDQKVDMQVRSGDPELVISGAALLGSVTVKLLR